MLANHPTVLGRAPTASSIQIGNVDGPTYGTATDNALVRWDGTTGRLIQNGVVTENDNTGTLNGPLTNSFTTAAGSAFTNQPANDGVEVLSANAGDTTQTVTIIGTTNATNTVVVETVTLNGTTPVSTVKTDWGLILAVKKSAATLGTVTVREASADQTITAGLTAAVLSVGVNTVTTTAAYNRILNAVASGATTKQVGFGGTNSSGTAIYDSVALAGATQVQSTSSFLTVTEIYTGDVEATRTVTVTANGHWNLIAGEVALTSGVTGGFSVYNTSDEVTNYERLNLSWASNVATITSAKAGSGTQRNLSIGSGTTTTLFDGTNNRADVLVAGAQNARFVSTHLLLGGLTADGTGILQLPDHSTSAGGISIGTGIQLFATTSAGTGLQATAASLKLAQSASAAAPGYAFSNASGYGMYQSGGTSLRFATGGVLSLDISGGAATTLLGGAGNMTIIAGSGASRTLTFQTTTSGSAATTFLSGDASQNLTISNKIVSYNSVTTAGWGISTVQADGAIAATTNARSAAIATYTVGAADGTFIVSAYANVTTSTTHSFSLDCSYTDETNTARVLVMPVAQLAGGFVATGLITNVTGAGPYESSAMTIRCKASTSITIRPSAGGTYTTVVYNTAANIRQVG